MFLKQFYLGCLAHASYIVVDPRTHTAAVIDPQRDIDQYVEEAERQDATIKYVFLTHFHADFVAGHLELRDRLGARIYLGSRAQSEYDFTQIKDGDALQFGNVRLKVLETPGHTPEGISIVAYDLAKSDECPEAVFTGDTLFVGDVGRPDLMASVGVSADELAGWLYDSLHEKLMVLPDETTVYPAHGAGSMCGKNLGKETFSTIGEQRRYNYALQPMTKEEFIAIVTADQPEAPSYFGYDAMMNRQERITLEESLRASLSALSVEEVIERQEAGTQVLDAREPADFAGSHLSGSTNIPLSGQFATWAGTILSRDAKVIIIAEPGNESQVAMRLGRIGLDSVAGYLDGGMGALCNHPELLNSHVRITAQALASHLGKVERHSVLDVRTRREWDQGHVKGSINIPLNTLEKRLGELPMERTLAVICRTGYRSSIASSLLLRNGIRDFHDVVGGMEAWAASDLPIIRSATEAEEASS